jgi:hypothetical protein
MAGPFSLRRLAWAGPASILAALIVNSIYYFITRALGESYLIPLDATGTRIYPMPALMFILPTLVVGLAAWAFFALLIRISRVAGIVFLSVAIAALVLSLGGPSSLPNTPLRTQVLLAGMNLLTAICLTGGMLWLSKTKGRLDAEQRGKTW